MDGVSVLIPAFNAEHRLPRCLEYLSRQDLPREVPWEVIVIDNNSSDRTSETAEAEWRRLGAAVPLHVLHEPVPGVSHARRRGIDAAKYDVLVFCDDDNWLDPDYLRIARETLLKRPDVGVVGGVTLPFAETELPEWFSEYAMMFTCARRAEESCDLSESNWIAGAGTVVRRSTLRAFFDAGFEHRAPGRKGDLLLANEDVEVCLWHRLIGQKLWYETSLKLLHFQESRKLTREYAERVAEGLKQSREFLMPATRVLWGLQYRSASPMKRLKLVLKLSAKAILGRNIQPEAVAFLPATRFLLNSDSRQILESLARFETIRK